MQQYRFEFKDKFLLISVSCLFLILFLLISYFNRFSEDDYFTIHSLKVNSVFNFLQLIYNHWNFRLGPILLCVGFFKIHNFPYLLFIYGAISLTAIIFSAYFLLKNIFNTYLNFNPGKTMLLAYSILFCSLFFFVSFRIDETWFWLASSVTYLWGNIMLIAGTTFLISDSRRFITIFCLAICFAYVGSSSEPLAITTIALLFVLIVSNILRKKNDLTLKLSFAIIACLIAFLFNCYAPGQAIRSAVFQAPSVANGLFITLKVIVKIVLFELPGKIIYIILFSFPFAYIGKLVSINNQNKVPFISRDKKK